MPLRRNACCRLLVAALLLLLAQGLLAQGGTPAAGPGGKRLALVIGNAAYPSAPLKNPVNDARAMARTLKELGFEVVLRENIGQRDMAAVVRQFGASISPGSTTLFYFAGHGMQVKGRNYLVPVDADIQLEDEVPYATIDVSLVLDKMEVGKSAINLVILDACRNNPFARRFRSSATGLAQMDAPVGTLIAFATAPGSVAQDGSGANGVYTQHLLESIATPGLPVEQMFKRVRIGVAKATHDSQIPWESSSMKGDFVFREAPPAASQDKLIEDAVKAAAERAATLTAERIAREQAARQPSAPVRAEQDALAAEREKLLRERERLAAENEALRRKAAQAPIPAPVSTPPPPAVALAAPTAVAAAKPAAAKAAANGLLPAVGDRWTYRYSDGYGKTETYTVRITAVTGEGIQDEMNMGKVRKVESFEPGLELYSRGGQAGIALREFAPYLQALGPAEPNAEWKNIQLMDGSGPFAARWAGKETVKVLAGTFEASKLIIDGEHYARGVQTRKLTIQVWYAPEAKRFVKMSYSAPSLTGGIAADKDVIELVETSLPLAGAAAAPARGETQSTTMVASSKPSVLATPSGPLHVGDSWTYRFSDVYGKSETFTVRVTAASPSGVADEVRIGKARHNASFEPILAITHRKLGNLTLREPSPYLLHFGMKESGDWKKIEVFEGKESFTARLAGTESVQVPAGTFEAQKLVIEGREHHPRLTGMSRTYTITAWYAPAARRIVKLTTIGATHSLFPAEQETLELTEYRLQ
ncbi:MAG: hypothetical protein HKUEN07_30360 [Rhodocyclaceae bacterium]|jgi:uncharacterized caspase-like protein|uniref:Caspase family protein n=1 Tax=Candidatus Desulfobacillus denitrificans TaxID=2608985 RepID=A0A809S323_9PROT|nr:caspase family protein [Candidatus Desulfobacillus denitrificans]GJQ56467.1 MAG: hypothetical protein HKUEN07_30360 [Rhodocyclaceae bacterium]